MAVADSAGLLDQVFVSTSERHMSMIPDSGDEAGAKAAPSLQRLRDDFLEESDGDRPARPSVLKLFNHLGV